MNRFRDVVADALLRGEMEDQNGLIEAAHFFTAGEQLAKQVSSI